LPFKLLVEVFAVVFLIMLNLRGVKESVTVLQPDLPGVPRDATRSSILGVILGRIHEAQGRRPEPGRKPPHVVHDDRAS